MIKIIHVEVCSDPQEPFTWLPDDTKSGSLYAFHRVIEQRQRYLLGISNLLSHLGSMHKNQNHLIHENIMIFFDAHPEIENTVTKKGRWTTYKQKGFTIMTEETLND